MWGTPTKQVTGWNGRHNTLVTWYGQPLNETHIIIIITVTMSVLNAVQNANTAFSDIPIMSARLLFA